MSDELFIRDHILFTSFNIKINLKMSQIKHRERNQIENKKGLEILVKDEKYWREKVVKLAKQFSISDEDINASNVSK